MNCSTPELSATASTSPSSSSPSPPPPPVALTRRQRKALGLPKPRPALVAAAARPRGASGKIVIPGGRYKRGVREGDEQEEAEWQRNGTGRVDVRGFKELKI
jgi:hypothetical protein